MKHNMGVIDKVIRVLIALFIMVLYYKEVINGILAIVLLVVGGIFTLTSIIGFCPIYGIFGLSSRPKKERVRK